MARAEVTPPETAPTDRPEVIRFLDAHKTTLVTLAATITVGGVALYLVRRWLQHKHALETEVVEDLAGLEPLETHPDETVQVVLGTQELAAAATPQEVIEAALELDTAIQGETTALEAISSLSPFLQAIAGLGTTLLRRKSSRNQT